MKKNPLVFFNFLKELLLVQKQTIHQQKAWDLSYLEPEGHGRGNIRRVSRPLAAKSIGVRGVKKVILRQVIVTPS